MNNLNTPIAHPSGKYIRQAKLTLQNYFPQISCAAIDAVLHSTRYSFKDSVYFLSNIESQRSAIDGNGAGHFGGVPSHIKVLSSISVRKRSLRLPIGMSSFPTRLILSPSLLTRKRRFLSTHQPAKKKLVLMMPKKPRLLRWSASAATPIVRCRN